MKWINAEEHTPPNNSRVIISYRWCFPAEPKNYHNTMKITQYTYQRGYSFNDSELFDMFKVQIPIKVTHWMLAPEFPEILNDY